MGGAAVLTTLLENAAGFSHVWLQNQQGLLLFCGLGKTFTLHVHCMYINFPFWPFSHTVPPFALRGNTWETQLCVGGLYGTIVPQRGVKIIVSFV